VASGFSNAWDVAVEAGGATALVSEAGTNHLLRVTLSSGAITVVSTTCCSRGIAIESGGATAIAIGGAGLVRVNLTTGAVTSVATITGGPCGFTDYEYRLALVSATTAAVVQGCPNQLSLVNLTTGVVTPLTSELAFGEPWGVAVESGGATALVTDRHFGGRIYRINLTTGAMVQIVAGMSSLVAYSARPNGIAVDASGNYYALDESGNRLMRGSTTGSLAPSIVASSIENPTGIAVESAGTTALVLDCGANTWPSPASDCTKNGRLVRANLSTGAITPIATSLNAPASVAIESGGATALVSDCGPTPGSCSGGRVLRITLSSGAPALVASGFNAPDGIAIEAGGTSALLAENAGGRLLRVLLGSGAFTVVGTGLAHPRNVVIEPGGKTALVAVDNDIARVDLSGGAVSTAFGYGVDRFALESGGTTALVLGANPPTLVRANVVTRALDVLAYGTFDHGGSIVINGGSAYYTETRPGSGVFSDFTTP
jgi:sugar lactone lactonase YvrE